MLSQRNPGLRRTDAMSNSFSGCISDATKEFSRAPEMSFPEIVSQPRMLLQQTESTVTLEKLKSFADAHCSGQFNEQMDVINSDVKIIDFTAFPVSNFSNEVFTIHPDAIKLHRVHRILAFPNEVESVLPEAMLSRFQIHFSSPISHAKFSLVHGLRNQARIIQEIKFYKGGGNSSVGLKAEVSLPRM
jgi:hypothetical protein